MDIPNQNRNCNQSVQNSSSPLRHLVTEDNIPGECQTSHDLDIFGIANGWLIGIYVSVLACYATKDMGALTYNYKSFKYDTEEMV